MITQIMNEFSIHYPKNLKSSNVLDVKENIFQKRIQVNLLFYDLVVVLKNFIQSSSSSKLSKLSMIHNTKLIDKRLTSEPIVNIVIKYCPLGLTR